MPTREAVMTALLAKAATATGFQTISRRLQLIPGASTPQVAVPPAQPALYLFEGDEDTVNNGLGKPAIRTWHVELWAWCKIPLGATIGVPDGTTPGATVINNLIEAIETALKPDDALRNALTLGGLVYQVNISGRTIKVPGDVNPDGQCLAIIPIRIVVP
jgi:hypothetical protein